MENFTNLYSLSKTLRFELVPTEETKKLLKKNGVDKNLLQYFLEKDRQLAKDYEIIKHLVDEYHKYFIEKSLNPQYEISNKYDHDNEETDNAVKSDRKPFTLSENDLKNFEDLFVKDSKDDDDNEKIKKLKNDLRKQIANQFKEQPEYRKLESKELLKAGTLLDIAENDEAIGKLNEASLIDEKIEAIFTLDEIREILDDWATKQKKEKSDSDKKKELKKRLLKEIKLRTYYAELKELLKQEFEDLKEEDWEENIDKILNNEKVKEKIEAHPIKSGKPQKKLKEALFGLPGIILSWLNGDGVKAKVLENLKRSGIIKDEKELNQAIKTFQSGFFTYLRPFCENRKENLYTEEYKTTGIAKRIIDDNLPKFLYNQRIYGKHESFFDSIEEQLKSQLKDDIEFNSLTDFFSLEGFNKVLVQNEYRKQSSNNNNQANDESNNVSNKNDNKQPLIKGIDAYNLLISGKKHEKDKLQIKGLNQLINEHNQTAEKDNRIPKLKKLFKLPLSDSESASFSFKPFESDREALIAVNDFYEKVITNNEELKEKESSQPVNLLEELKKILNNIQSSDKIFIRRSMLNSISARIFDKEGIENKWNIINQALVEYYGDKKIKGSPGDVINAINDKLGELDAEKRELAPTRKKKGQHKQEKSNELKKLEKEILRLKNKRKKFMGYLTAENGMSKWLRTKKYFSILVIESALLKYKCKQGLDEKIKSCISDKPICDYFKTLGKLNGETKDLFEKIIEEYNNVNELLVDVGNMEDEKRLEKDDKVKIKSFLERFNKKFENKNEDELSLLQFIKPLAIGEDVEDFDNGFYEGVTKDNTRQYGFSELYEQIASGNNGAAGILPIYNKVRSRFQKKDYSTDAIRLCFDKGTLAGGWTESNESTQYFTYLFRKENKKYNEKYKITDESRKEYEYFLGISHDTGLFSCNWGLKMEEQTGDEWDEFQRLNYYQLNPTKQNNILKKFLINFSAGNNHLQDKISKHFKEKNTTAITCAESLKTEFQSQFENLKRQNQLNSKLLNDLPIGPKSILFTTDYFESVKDFASLFNDLRKKEFKYLKVNKQELENALCGYSVDENGEIHTRQPLLLFKITNKDLSYAETHLAGKRNCDENGNERKARGEFKENLHTIYFRHLMSGSQNIIDLGTGMLFFRTASKERKITHEKEKPVKNKRWELLNEVDKENFKAESTFSYDLVKDRRFTYEKDKSEGKYFLHLSTQFNYMTGIGSDKADINNNVLEWIKSQKDNKDFRIIGIDRGERHLLYVTIVDYNGKIQKQFSLNIPEPEESKFKTDYKKLLDKSSSERRESQRNWDDAVMITKLKKGYLSYALNRICSEIIKDGKPNAIIVLEHLSRGFMQQRPIDNSVYAKFEEMLIKKLNWLTYKDQINEPTRAGGVLNGWQLTEEYSVRNIDIKKQNGIIFFVPAKYTSRIDPATGFVNFFSYSKLPFESANNARDFFSRFASIKYNNVAFEFDFDYENFKFSNENKRMKESNTDKKVKERKDSGFLFLVNDVAGEMKWTIRTNDSMRFTRDRKANEGRGGQKPINVFAYDEAVKKDADLKSKIEKIAGNINQQLKYLLKEVGAVDYTNGDIKKALQNNKLKADFFKKLLQLFFSAVTLRQNNGKTGAKEEDLINSLVVKRGGENITVTDTLKPENADSNGAYHIALKGLFLLKRLNEISIDEFEKSKKSKDGKSQWVPNSEWLNFVQSNFN